MNCFVHWYNETHRHSQIRFVTPAQRHRGEDRAILNRRIQVCVQAKERMVRGNKKLDASRPCHSESGAKQCRDKQGRVIKRHDSYLEKHRYNAVVGQGVTRASAKPCRLLS
jgi:hypothetical protein